MATSTSLGGVPDLWSGEAVFSIVVIGEAARLYQQRRRGLARRKIVTGRLRRLRIDIFFSHAMYHSFVSRRKWRADLGDHS
jgi:hypothetical protein